MTESQKDTEFLRQAILFGDKARCGALEECIARVQRDTSCVKRALWLVALLGAMAGAGFFYGSVLEDNFPHGKHRLLVKLIDVTALTSSVWVIALSGLLVVYRTRLNKLRADCRRVVAEALESHGQATSPSAIAAREIQETELQVDTLH